MPTVYRVRLERSASVSEDWHSFSKRAQEFVNKTEKYVNQGVNPGGYYKAVWCRDASYILKDWFLSGAIDSVMHEIPRIWSHQIEPEKEKIVYGRGSPEMKYLSQVANSDFEKKFKGALPTSIFRGHSEVFGKNPDVDSTALMISTTSWIFDAYLEASLPSNSDLPPKNQVRKDAGRSHAPDPSETIDSVMPKMLKAVDYLQSRDIDDDGLLEQDHNEDWMDSVLRAGKIVYTQACWIMALTNLSSLLSHIKMEKEASRMRHLADRTISAVEKELWAEDEECYLDKQESHHLGKSFKTLTQDVSLYLVATTEKTARDRLGSRINGQTKGDQRGLPPVRGAAIGKKTLASHANSTLAAVKSRVWKDKCPLVTEIEMKSTGPWILHPNVYHNHTFWPWATGLEMLARGRYERYNECTALLSYMTGYDANGDCLAFCEWVNPVTGKRGGAFPFRTGISAIRIAITDMLGQEYMSKNKDMLA
jgi:hypothetical protein